MTSTQAQIAGSSDVATSLVFSVQGRVVERSSRRWRLEVFVAGIYPGCRIILLNLISARVISIPQSHLAACTEQQQRPGGEKALLRSCTSLSLSGNYFVYACGSCAGWLCCMPLANILLGIGYGVNTTWNSDNTTWNSDNTTWNSDTYVLYWNNGDDRLCT